MYKLSPLPYDYDALEPHIDEATMRIHHDKHHQGYLDKFNAALEEYPELAEGSADEVLFNFAENVANKLPEAVQTAIKNNGGGYVHHNIFWETMSSDGARNPQGELAKKIEEMGGFEEFKKTFSEVAMKQFGAGWAWLVVDQEKNLKIYSLPNQDSPLLDKEIPILGVDVWEHSYYLKYQNRRADFVEAWWNVLDWNKIEEKYQAALKK